MSALFSCLTVTSGCLTRSLKILNKLTCMIYSGLCHLQTLSCSDTPPSKQIHSSLWGFHSLEPNLDFHQPLEQAVFKIGFGTNEHLQLIKFLIEKVLEYNKPWVLIFVDFEKAFDSVQHNSMLKPLTESSIDHRCTTKPNSLRRKIVDKELIFLQNYISPIQNNS